jgi:2-polyprenyl-3-methyl-5-hydroxy-6-metoxy-1,4-benzoquinol methylase
MPRLKNKSKLTPNWKSGKAYEEYMGRWSRLVAREFVPWLGVSPGKNWLDVGCGTGALTQVILEKALPKNVQGIDASPEFVDYARDHIQDTRVGFRAADVEALFSWKETFDAVISGLVLNFMPGPDGALESMKQVTDIGGTIGAYVWDYAAKMEYLRFFWDAAIDLDSSVKSIDEGRAFTICEPEELRRLFLGANLHTVDVCPIDIKEHFRNFEELWVPFRSGVGPAPTYVMSLSESNRGTLKEHLKSRIPTNRDGSIDLIARAWAVKSIRVKK